MFRLLPSLPLISTLRSTTSISISPFARHATKVRLQHTFPRKFSDVFDPNRIPRYDPANPSPVMQSYTAHFPSSSSPLVQVDFDGSTRIFILTMLGKETPDNRLTHKLIGEGLVPALTHVEDKWHEMQNSGHSDQGSALITTGGTDPSAKIFSNGLDFENAIADPHFFDRHLNTLYEKLLTFPIPTIAAVNGHAFAAGFGLACAHDYRIMNEKRGYMCMNEIDFGAPLPHGLQQALASKIANQKDMRKTVLEGHRWGAREALEAGIVDGLGESPKDVLEKAKELAEKLKGKAKMGCWGTNKEVIYAGAIKVLRTTHDDATAALYQQRAKM